MKIFDKHFKVMKVALIMVFLVYLLVLCKVVLFKFSSPLTVIDSILNLNLDDDFKRHVKLNSNFLPFKTILSYVFYESNKNIVIRNVLGNLVLFLPFGFLLPMFVGRKLNYVRIIILSFFMSLVLELVQLFARVGSFDIDDLLLNTIGATFGVITQKIIIKIIKTRTNLTSHRLN
ncbi:VanZ family protein [Paenibacillus sp. LMG 31458]|uniref:VanZ family protein n=1 Tax=Paenibacillus phytorum TaxID=2654977 RepID=A0ABX1Y2C3_9BACL|nr:VanZ family protein [Paenibacillus phytorum]NOU74251.1 VanZ family protein [Paenibacillus phytorum]